MEIRYCVFDPNGNITILVETAVATAQQAGIAAQLLAQEPLAEQVGFLSSGGDGYDISLRMAGGEFCGNASLCTAAYKAMRLPGFKNGCLHVAVSGAAEPVVVSLQGEDSGVWRGTVEMPLPLEISTVQLPLGSGTAELPCVRFPGICHVIDVLGLIPEAEAESRIHEWCRLLGSEALGIMHCDLAAGALAPLVYVAGIDSLYHEHSCASGTSAAAAYLASQNGGAFSGSFVQPGGTLFARAGQNSLQLGGKTVLLKQAVFAAAD